MQVCTAAGKLQNYVDRWQNCPAERRTVPTDDGTFPKNDRAAATNGKTILKIDRAA